MMNESVCIHDISLSTPSEGDDEQVDVVASKTKKWTRGRNFPTTEDTALVMAWKSVNIDLVVGSDQNTNTYWKRIADHFHHIASVSTDCSIKPRAH